MQYLFGCAIVNYEEAHINRGARVQGPGSRGDRRAAPCSDKQMHLSHRDVKNCIQTLFFYSVIQPACRRLVASIPARVIAS